MAWIQNLKNWERLQQSAEYMKKVYGDPLAYLNADKTEFVTEREYFGDFGYGECFNSTSSEVQCELITGEFDPKQLPYEKRLAWHFREFCYKTSAHGIPMIGQAPNRYYRGVWVLLFVGCMTMLYYNANSVLDKYNRNEKIVDIQLKFDTAPFPAITLCNLNPYKASLASNVELVRRTLAAFQNAMPHHDEEATEDEEEETHMRFKRSDNSQFEPGYAKCKCGASSEEIMDEHEEYEEGDEEETTTHKMESKACSAAECIDCLATAFCDKKLSGPNGTTPCLCSPDGEDRDSDFCVAYNDKTKFLEVWVWLAGGPTTEDPNFLAAMGFAGMTDEVAIVTKAKENIMFAMATLSMDERQNLSNTKRELIHKCSFNGGACDIDNDFITHIDPVFGSCYTFNHNRTRDLMSIRAGPMYGLRMLVYVNASDYMPTTEATGVRLTIHDKEDFPFPDTFGYSAPTGYVSSFGLRLRKMTRLPAPYGDCIPDGKTAQYIYPDFEYSVEGCYRSCFQFFVLAECKCGDPRFPVPEGAKHCEAVDPVARSCLDEQMNKNGGLQGSFKCRCQQPCHQSIYTVTYSPAKWPSQSLQIQLGSCNGTAVECNKHYKENGAMVEVFYEQLNFEMLKESEAYGFVNLLADFGGQLGLWCGISFLTCCEFAFLFMETAYITGEHKYAEYQRKKAEKERQKRLGW